MEIELLKIANTIIINNGKVNSMGLLNGKMGLALFLYYYARYIDPRYKAYADQLIEEIQEKIQKERHSGYADGLAGVGVGIEHLIQQGFIEGDANEILEEFDEHIHNIVTRYPGQIDMINGITGYGKYYIARLNDSNNHKNNNPCANRIREQLFKIVDLLSMPYDKYEHLYSVIDFLPDIINLNINREKAVDFFNYASDKLETIVYEDVLEGKYPENFNPLIAAVLLLRASTKINNDDYAARALHFLDQYEVSFRQYLSGEQAIKWSFLYNILWKACNRDIYKELSIQWLEKFTTSNLIFDYNNLSTTGMMMLTMDKTMNDEWLDLFPLY